MILVASRDMGRGMILAMDVGIDGVMGGADDVPPHDSPLSTTSAVFLADMCELVYSPPTCVSYYHSKSGLMNQSCY